MSIRDGNTLFAQIFFLRTVKMPKVAAKGLNTVGIKAGDERD